MAKNIVKTEEVVGVSVENNEGEDLGKIESLMLDKLSGKVVYVVLSFGGFLGMGDKYFAMPWHVFSYDPDREKFVIGVDKERLKNSPGFDKDNWPDMSTPEWSATIDEYYTDI
ncbi:PRC-barrel domain-containing protein [Legionella saoudiensis]|uniref:PRC-barrel domain-containing protein n=1 Tax=Legionella saoudiensis TaxID=1750561 RepID=UPI000730B59B|nr:PRC-barrel domain-containing protein [Legionella saoudiensis]